MADSVCVRTTCSNWVGAEGVAACSICNLRAAKTASMTEPSDQSNAPPSAPSTSTSVCHVWLARCRRCHCRCERSDMAAPVAVPKGAKSQRCNKIQCLTADIKLVMHRLSGEFNPIRSPSARKSSHGCPKFASIKYKVAKF